MLCYCTEHCTEFHQNLPDHQKGSIVLAVAICPISNYCTSSLTEVFRKNLAALIKTGVLISLKGALLVPQNKRRNPPMIVSKDDKPVFFELAFTYLYKKVDD